MKTFYEAIIEWVGKAYGSQEAEDPSWSVEALADHLSKTDIKPDELNADTKWLVYDQLRERNLEQDINQVAESKDIKLTSDEVARIKHQYYKLDDATWEQLSILIDDMKGE